MVKKKEKKGINQKPKKSRRILSYFKANNYSCLYYNVYQGLSESRSLLLPPPDYVLSIENIDSEWNGSVLFISGKLNNKKLMNIKKIYQKMGNPKWVVVLGSIAMSGGINASNGFGMKQIEEEVSVDLFIPGNPCSCDAIKDGLESLKNKIQNETCYET